MWLDRLPFVKKELLVTTDPARLAAVTAALTAAGIPYVQRHQYTGSGTRRAGGFAAVGERADLSTLYTLLVPARHWDAARRALQQSFHP